MSKIHIRRWLHAVTAGTIALVAAACASPDIEGAYNDVNNLVRVRAGGSLPWYGPAVGQSQTQPRVRELLSRPLSADGAVELAFLRNPQIQGALAELGIAEADVDQAGRPRNPELSLARLLSGVELELEAQLLVNVLSILTMPQRIEIAEKRAEKIRYQVALEIVRVGHDVRGAWVEAVASKERLAITETIFEKTKIAAELARRMANVGSMPALEQAKIQAFKADVAAQLGRARLARQVNNERLTRQLGLWGSDTAYRLPKRLPDLPARPKTLVDLERTALLQRLDVTAARLELELLASTLNLTERTARISLLEISALGNRVKEVGSGGEPTSKFKQYGPELEISIPIFDRGDAKIAKAEWTYLRAVEQLKALAVKARSEVREAYLNYRGLYDIARHYQRDVAPLRNRITQEELLRYNGMLVGVFELIDASRQEAQSVSSAIDAKKDFWLADGRLQFVQFAGSASGGSVSGGETEVAQAGGEEH